jgi:hypothetical protein
VNAAKFEIGWGVSYLQLNEHQVVDLLKRFLHAERYLLGDPSEFFLRDGYAIHSDQSQLRWGVHSHGCATPTSIGTASGDAERA